MTGRLVSGACHPAGRFFRAVIQLSPGIALPGSVSPVTQGMQSLGFSIRIDDLQDRNLPQLHQLRAAQLPARCVDAVPFAVSEVHANSPRLENAAELLLALGARRTIG